MPAHYRLLSRLWCVEEVERGVSPGALGRKLSHQFRREVFRHYMRVHGWTASATMRKIFSHPPKEMKGAIMFDNLHPVSGELMLGTVRLTLP